MSARPLVSIVIPAFNHACYLEEAIESVLSQTYPGVELIVLDDGSTDHTRDVLARHSGRFHWESQPNIGQSATLSKGWSMARGEVLGYLSADDVLQMTAVDEALAVLQQKPAVVATYCDFELIDTESRAIRLIRTPDFDSRELIFNLVCHPGPGAFFRRPAYERAGPWDPALRQNPDLDFWMRLSLVGEFARIPKSLAKFRVHEASQTHRSADPARAGEPVRIVERFLSRPDLPRWIREGEARSLGSAWLATAQLHLRAGRVLPAASATFSALRVNPRAALSVRSWRVLLHSLFGRLAHHVRASRVTATPP